MLAKKKKMTQKDVKIVRSGNQITLPDAMSFDEGIKWLQRKKTEENSKVQVSMEIDCFPLDGAYALKKAIMNIHGFASNPSGYTDFFGNWVGTTMIGMSISPTEVVQVPWGPVQLPTMEGSELETAYNHRKGVPNFSVGGVIIKKHQKKVQAIFEETRRIVKEESVYCRRALKVDFSWSRNEHKNPDGPPGFRPGKDEPVFWDVSDIVPAELVFSHKTQGIVDLTLFDLIRNPDLMRQHKVPLKRGVLFVGRYGVGKTMTAGVTAHYGMQNGWTFFYLKDVRDIAMALRLAQQYSPAIVFAEDIDRVMKGEERTVEMDEVLNTIDGVDTKSAEIITVLTTNHLEEVSRPMLRAGRLDAVIEIQPPDTEAAARLVRVYGRNLMAPDFDYEAVGQALEGFIPATIREVVERAKVCAIARVRGDITGQMDTEDVLAAANLMTQQLKLTAPTPHDEREPIEKAADALGGHLSRAMALLASAAHSRPSNGPPGGTNGSVDELPAGRAELDYSAT